MPARFNYLGLVYVKKKLKKKKKKKKSKNNLYASRENVTYYVRLNRTF